MAALIKALILIPLALVLILLAVSNRGPVTMSLEPFWTTPLVMPLYAFVLACVAAGVVLGGISTWLVQGRHRRAERRTRRENRDLRYTVDRAKDRDILRDPARAPAGSTFHDPARVHAGPSAAALPAPRG